MPDNSPPKSHKISLIGMGADGWDGLNQKAQQLISKADRLIGGKRHLDLLPPAIRKDKQLQSWPSVLKPFLNSLINDYKANKFPDEKIIILASGNPMLYGIGATLQNHIPSLVQVIPHISTQTLICAQMGWAEQDTTLISLCGRPLEQLNAALFNNQCLVLLSNDNTSPSKVAQFLLDTGFDDSTITVFENISGENEKTTKFQPSELTNQTSFSKLNAMAIQLKHDGYKTINKNRVYSTSYGLPETAYRHDGQITKKEIRAITLAALSPRPNELLIDIGSGSGSIAIEWMRAAPNANANAIEPRASRAENIKHNANKLGVPSLVVIQSSAQDYLKHISGADAADAIFIGGGLTSSKDLILLCLTGLKGGGRLVINAVTLESEALLYETYKKHGGNLTKIQVSKPDKIGSFESWNAARPVTQWHYIKPYSHISLDSDLRHSLKF